MSRFNSLSDALDLLVEQFEAEPDWEAIFARQPLSERPSAAATGSRGAALPRRARVRWLVRWRFLTAAAFATGLADRFSAWINGKPG